MSFFTRQEEIGTGVSGTLRSHEDVVTKPKRRQRTGKWPLRWVTLSVLTICGAFWIAFFALIF